LLEKYCVKVMLTAIVVACFVPFLFLGDGAQKWTLFFRATAKHIGQLKRSGVTKNLSIYPFLSAFLNTWTEPEKCFG
jgi:hypothetical protein